MPSLVILASSGLLLAEQKDVGVVVESVAGNSAADRAGLHPEDLIRWWSRGPAKGKIHSPFELMEVETEQAPRGLVTLVGERAGRWRHWTLPPGDWGFETRPVQTEDILNLYLDANNLHEAGNSHEAFERWRRAANQIRSNAATWRSAWFLFRAAQSLGRARQWKEADEAYHEAIQRAAGAGPIVVGRLLQSWADTFSQRDDWVDASKYYQQWLAGSSKLSAQSLSFAAGLYSLGLVANERGDLAAAEKYYRRALAIREKLAPRSLAVAVCLHHLGNVFVLRGDLNEAENYYKRALILREKLAPGSLEVAGTLNGLGTVSTQRGDLATAQEYFRRSLAIREKLAPESLQLAKTLDNLGLISWRRDDLVKAEEYEAGALAIRTKLAPGTLEESGSLNNIGLVFWRDGDLVKAEEYYSRALAIREKLAPGSLGLAETLNNLGCVFVDRSDPARAEVYLQRALAIWEKSAPGRLFMSATLYRLGEAALERGDLAKAEECYRRALAIRERLAPGSESHADTLASLGQVMRQRGRLDIAAEFYGRAIAAFDQQTIHLGGTESIRSRFRSQHARYYRDYIDVLLIENKPQLAFQVLERSRARSLLEMLAERDLLFAADLPPAIQLARQQNAAAYDRTQSQIAALGPQNDAQIEQLLKQLRDLEREREEITEQVRRASPRLAALQYPQPLSLAAVRKILDPGTVLLSYSVGRDHTSLFAVQPAGSASGISVFTLPIGANALREQVNHLRDLPSRAEFQTQSRKLYDLLVRPAEPLVSLARRILISPDGPLYKLPFACLLRNENQYLIEWKPLDTVQSATVYAELKNRRNRKGGWPLELVAFGDPEYPAPQVQQTPMERVANSEPQGVNRLSFMRLPYSRAEVNAIASLYPGNSQVFLGAQATEERAKRIGRNIRYVHFATHALFDQHFPLNSALVLTLPVNPREGEDNGLLQAWEIFEQVRIDADLVTLSACQTGLGEDWEGEGLIGLTRAFLYAGAHSILASQWTAQDVSTAEFMKRFYRHLKNGASKDEALQQTQLEFLHLPQFASPFYWAAFFLVGDPL